MISEGYFQLALLTRSAIVPKDLCSSTLATKPRAATSGGREGGKLGIVQHGNLTHPKDIHQLKANAWNPENGLLRRFTLQMYHFYVRFSGSIAVHLVSPDLHFIQRTAIFGKVIG